MGIEIGMAVPEQAGAVAEMAGELLGEIMNRTGRSEFHFDLAETEERLRAFLGGEGYFVLVAEHAGQEIGFAALCENRALYAEGVFGTLSEFYVRSEYRSNGVGTMLLEAVKGHAAARAWTRLEVTTPPLPEFEGTLRFYERAGFAVTGGRKLKVLL